MKREELARTLAREGHVSGAKARDEVDELVRKILKALREGRPVELPGMGRLVSKAAAGATGPRASAESAPGGNQSRRKRE